MEQLILRILEHDTASLHAEWALFRNGYKVAASKVAALLSTLRENIPATTSDERCVVVLVPGQQVLLTTVEIPPKQRRHLRKVLPFLVEEQLAEDIAQLHIATGIQENENSRLPVAVVRKSLMQGWLQALQAAGFVPHVMLPETLVMPSHSQAWSLLHDGNTVWLRTGPYNMFAVEPIMLPGLVGLLIGQKTPGTVSIECHLSGTAHEDDTAQQLMQLQQTYTQISLRVKGGNPIMDIFCDGYMDHSTSRGPFLNLLQGEFQPLGSGSATAKTVQGLVKIAAIWFIAMVVINVSGAHYFSSRSDEVRTQALELYQQLFPEDTKIIDPIHQMKNHLALNTSAEGKGFIKMMTQLATHWGVKSDSPVQMQSIVYREDDQSLTINVTAGSIEALNTLAQQLNVGGLSVKVVSVVNDKDSITGQLAVKEAGK